MMGWLETVALAAFMAGLMGGCALRRDVRRHRVPVEREQERQG